MHNTQVPDALHQQQQISTGQISFIHYQEQAPVGRNLIAFNKCAVSFILSGQKELYRLSDTVTVHQHEGVVIPYGNSIIAERQLNSLGYSSLVAFFPQAFVADFMNKHKALFAQNLKYNTPAPGFVKFKVNAALTAYQQHLLGLISHQVPLSPAMISHKLEELLLMLMELHPAQFEAVFQPFIADDIHQLKAIVENNLLNGLSLPELAFLANRSLATFKRDFEKAYGTSPGRYIRERKLELASHALLDGKKATAIALELGYEQLSNFNTAFKRKFNQTPNAYQASYS